MSSTQLDGTHTPSKRGGEAVAYQGRKKCKTTNMLIITDANGIPVACSDPIAGNHNDAFELKDHANEMFNHIKECNIATEGLFLNADAAFDTQDFRETCYTEDIIGNIDFNKRNGKTDRDEPFDETLYKQRFVIERTNAWVDAFKALLTRFETKKQTWRSLNILAFIVILLRCL